jgi:hypothetical protein
LPDPFADCDQRTALDPRDFFTLPPGGQREVLALAEAFGIVGTWMYKGVKPGECQMIATYVMAGKNPAGSKAPDPFKAKAVELWKKAYRCEVTSNAVTVRFAAAPETEVLLGVLAGKEKWPSAVEALLLLGARRDERGLEPTLKALKHDDAEVRWAAAFALRHYAAAFSVGQLNDKDIIPTRMMDALKQAAADPSPRVREVAGISLGFAQQYLEAARKEKGK